MQILVGKENKVLRQISTKVDKFDKDFKKLIDEMKLTMQLNQGVGLAAPQIGINQRVIIVSLDNKQIVTMVNPKIVDFSEEEEVSEEGCLSLPGIWGNVKRAKVIKLKFEDEKGKETKLLLKDLNARIVQHEIDHLEGVLFIDRILENNKISQIKN